MRHPSLLVCLLLLPLACGDDGGGDEAGSPSTSATPTTGDVEDTESAESSGEPTTGQPEPTDDGPPADSGSSGEPDPTDTGTTGEATNEVPPTNGAELVPWLEAGEYLDWTAESGVHPSTGPHFSGVRTFVNPALLGSLDAGATAHPVDAAAVKELYDAAGTRLGWAVIVKQQADSAGGDGWYWFEQFDGSQFADGPGEGICTGCHAAGNDFFMSPFPLQ